MHCSVVLKIPCVHGGVGAYSSKAWAAGCQLNEQQDATDLGQAREAS
jgi:hypothetical protein